VSTATDVYERPVWLKQYLQVLTDYLQRLLARVLETGIKVILLDESWVGMGLSAATFNEFILPFDLQLVEQAHRAGVLVDFHNCGRIKAILEPMTDTGADVLEPLLPPSLNGELWLKDIKPRIGNRIALYGGFNERVLLKEPDDVRAEVRRCIDEAAAGGGYAIRGAGQIFDAELKNLQVMTDEVHRYGKYA
jgi:uroporphyrinogen decarboxylase